MVDRIYNAKAKVLERIDRAIAERGAERMDVQEMGMLADIVKDLSEAEKSCWEAEYYRSVSEAMGAQGYVPGGPDYGEMDPMGYRDRMGRYARAPRRGYGPQGHDTPHGYQADPMQGVRDAMSTAAPEQRERMMREMRSMLGM